MGFYLVIEKNEIMSFAAKWMELVIIMLNKINHTQNDKYCMFSLICAIFSKKKDMRVEGKLFGKRKRTSGREEGEQEKR
jgi:hypothetical protein